MKTFELGIETIKTVQSRDIITAAQENFTYEIVKRVDSVFGFDTTFKIKVIMDSTDEVEFISVDADKGVFLSELDDIIWEAIAEDFVTEIK